jgi:hypothetical protein
MMTPKVRRGEDREMGRYHTGNDRNGHPENLVNECLRKLFVEPESVNAIGIAFAAPVADGVPVG